MVKRMLRIPLMMAMLFLGFISALGGDALIRRLENGKSRIEYQSRT